MASWGPNICGAQHNGLSYFLGAAETGPANQRPMFSPRLGHVPNTLHQRAPQGRGSQSPGEGAARTAGVWAPPAHQGDVGGESGREALDPSGPLSSDRQGQGAQKPTVVWLLRAAPWRVRGCNWSLLPSLTSASSLFPSFSSLSPSPSSAHKSSLYTATSSGCCL